VLYRVLGSHLETFIERTETGDRELPGFVRDELRSFLACGIFVHGCMVTQYAQTLFFRLHGSRHNCTF